MKKLIAGQMAFGLPETLHESIRGYITDTAGAVVNYDVARVVSLRDFKADELLSAQLGGTGKTLRLTWSPERHFCSKSDAVNGKIDGQDPAHLLRVGTVVVDVDLTDPDVRPTENTTFKYNATTGQISDKAADQAFPAGTRVKFERDDAESGLTIISVQF
ncbi:MAG: hypothetical protein EBX50_01395 [Chitinophagia bacterium]|nr:hypothetical protein [Chitinophagia bacterium]